MSFAYDGPLPTTTTWSGAVTGSVSWQYDTFFRPISETVTTASGTSTVAVGYDNDGLITCVSPTTCVPVGTGALRLTRGGTTGTAIRHDGQITAVSVSPMTGTRTYNTYGELARQQDISGSTPYDLILDESSAPRDALGRITRKTETVRGVTTVEQYAYDAQGRLSDVYKGNTLAEHYTYDANGNRLSLATPSETLAATYDAQDRLLSYGPWSFEYTANGDLARKTNTLTGEATDYDYDALGNLKTVVLPGGDVIEYLWDGAGRRVGKVRNGVLVQQLLYRDGLNPVAELDGSGNLVSHFLYGEKPNVPSLIRRGSTTYRVFSDQVGSPVLVVNVSNATDVLFEASYSAFGEQTVTVGSADALPFGFAGGRWDAETGLVQFGARDYEPTIGRWGSKDPIRWDGGQANLYVYAGGDPVNFVDPTGSISTPMDPVDAPGGVGGVGSAAAGARVVAGTMAMCAWVWESLTEIFSKGGSQNVGDTGIENEAREIIRNPQLPPTDMCSALGMLWDAARGDSARRQRIKATQKKFNCRHRGGS